ncbi:16653_t:CDS:2 [Entrophospora sp. SA101]|nr:16653_t:CDS:2 [Entrophospora sp. SA101]
MFVFNNFNLVLEGDLALKEEFWNLHEFKQSEVGHLLINISGNGFPHEIKDGIISGKGIAIEFDNIKTECMKLNGVHDSWQKAIRISRSLMKKPEDEILNLKISDHYRPNQKTVQNSWVSTNNVDLLTWWKGNFAEDKQETQRLFRAFNETK